jgi:hypothetical protein
LKSHNGDDEVSNRAFCFVKFLFYCPIMGLFHVSGCHTEIISPYGVFHMNRTACQSI